MTTDRRLCYAYVPSDRLHQLVEGTDGRPPLPRQLAGCLVAEIRWDDARRAYRVLLWGAGLAPVRELDEIPVAVVSHG